MNPFNRIHHSKIKYTCCICKTPNHLNAEYLIDKNNYPPEVDLQHTSFLLAQPLPNSYAPPQGYLFVIDQTLSEK